MKLIKKLLIYLIVINQYILPAQQDPYQIYHRINWQIANPAAYDRAFYQPTAPAIIITGNTNRQWLGTEGAPQHHFISAEYAPYLRNDKMPPMRYGFQVALDKNNILSRLHLGGNFTWRIKLNKESNYLYAGANVEGVSNRIDISSIRLSDPYDLYATPKEQGGLLAPRSTYLDATLGIFYRRLSEKKEKADPNAFFCGFSLPQTITMGLNQSDSAGITAGAFRNFCVFLGWYLTPRGNNSGVDFEPAIWIRSTRSFQYYSSAFFKRSPLSLDANFRFYFGGSANTLRPFWAGLGWGTNAMFSGDIGYQWSLEGANRQVLRLGLGFAYPLGKVVPFGSSFEATVAYGFK